MFSNQREMSIIPNIIVGGEWKPLVVVLVSPSFHVVHEGVHHARSICKQPKTH